MNAWDQGCHAGTQERRPSLQGNLKGTAELLRGYSQDIWRMFPKYWATQPQKHALQVVKISGRRKKTQEVAGTGCLRSLSVENNEDCNVFHRHVQIHIRFAQGFNTLGAIPEMEIDYWYRFWLVLDCWGNIAVSKLRCDYSNVRGRVRR